MKGLSKLKSAQAGAILASSWLEKLNDEVADEDEDLRPVIKTLGEYEQSFLTAGRRLGLTPLSDRPLKNQRWSTGVQLALRQAGLGDGAVGKELAESPSRLVQALYGGLGGLAEKPLSVVVVEIGKAAGLDLQPLRQALLAEWLAPHRSAKKPRLDNVAPSHLQSDVTRRSEALQTILEEDIGEEDDKTEQESGMTDEVITRLHIVCPLSVTLNGWRYTGVCACSGRRRRRRAPTTC